MTLGYRQSFSRIWVSHRVAAGLMQRSSPVGHFAGNFDPVFDRDSNLRIEALLSQMNWLINQQGLTPCPDRHTRPPGTAGRQKDTSSGMSAGLRTSTGGHLETINRRTIFALMPGRMGGIQACIFHGEDRRRTLVKTHNPFSSSRQKSTQWARRARCTTLALAGMRFARHLALVADQAGYISPAHQCASPTIPTH